MVTLTMIRRNKLFSNYCDYHMIVREFALKKSCSYIVYLFIYCIYIIYYIYILHIRQYRERFKCRGYSRYIVKILRKYLFFTFFFHAYKRHLIFPVFLYSSRSVIGVFVGFAPIIRAVRSSVNRFLNVLRIRM